MWQRILFLGALAACSSNNAADAVQGTIRGRDYPIAESISAMLISPRSGAGSAAVIVMSSSTDSCLPPDALIAHPGETTVIIVVADGNAAPTAPGTFTVHDPRGDDAPPAKSAILYTSVLDPMCANHADDQTEAISGTVTLASAGGGVYAGQFDVELDSGDRITGTFSPAACEQLPAAFQSESTPTCKP
jgi:hypothetical protein